MAIVKTPPMAIAASARPRPLLCSYLLFPPTHAINPIVKPAGIKSSPNAGIKEKLAIPVAIAI